MENLLRFGTTAMARAVWAADGSGRVGRAPLYGEPSAEPGFAAGSAGRAAPLDRGAASITAPTGRLAEGAGVVSGGPRGRPAPGRAPARTIQSKVPAKTRSSS